MSLKAVRTVLTLDPDDLIRLQEILLDEDKDQALAYLREVIESKLTCAQDQSHRPEFEGGIKLQESHVLSKGVVHQKED